MLMKYVNKICINTGQCIMEVGMVKDGTEVVSADMGGTTDEGILDEVTTDKGTIEEGIAVGDIEAGTTTGGGLVVVDITPTCVALMDFMFLALSKLLAALSTSQLL